MGNILLSDISLEGKRVDIVISDGRIKSIRPVVWGGAETLKDTEGDECPFDEVMDCRGKAAVPGFINMHTHAGMSLMRGMQEDVVFSDWIDNIWKIETKVDADYVYRATRVAVLEMIKTGTTTFNDHYWFCPAAHKAAVEMGIRPVLSYVLIDKGNALEAEREKAQCERMYEESKSWKDNAVFEMGFHAIYSVSEAMILWASEFARRHGLRLHFHLSETRKEIEDCKAAHGGLSPVEYLDRLGVLDDHCLAAHTLWVSENDIEILGRRKVNCVHNINSNTKLASGYRFKYNELRDAGANVCLGTDGCASSNNLDILEAMKTSALFQKAWRDDPKAMPLEELLSMATVSGAKALGLNTGRISEGAEADLLIIDTESTFFLSPGSFLGNLIYSAHSDCIDSVIASGRFVMRHREVPGERDILRDARPAIEKIRI